MGDVAGMVIGHEPLGVVRELLIEERSPWDSCMSAPLGGGSGRRGDQEAAAMAWPAAWCVAGEDHLINRWDDGRCRLGRFWDVPPL
jgi:hypothetical protein